MNTPTDHQMEISVSRMLQVGITLSALVVLGGGLIFLKESPGLATTFHIFHPKPFLIVHLPDVLRSAASFDGSSIIQLGLLLLIATPIARVAFCLIGFARQRDPLYVAISATVLLILIYSLLQGGR